MNKKTLSYAIVIGLLGTPYVSEGADMVEIDHTAPQPVLYEQVSESMPVMAEDTSKLQEGDSRFYFEDDVAPIRVVRKSRGDVLPTMELTDEPIRIDADKMYYNDASGEVFARGDVEAVQGTKELRTPNAEGNAKAKVYRAMGGFHYMEEKGKLRDVKGESLQYDAGTGKIEATHVFGYMMPYWIKAERANYDSKEGHITKGWVTTKHAIAFKGVPDYRLEGDVIEVYPNDKMIVHNAKVFVKNAKVLSMKKYVTSLKAKDGIGLVDFIPRPSYNSTDGVGIKGRFTYPLSDTTNAYFKYNYAVKSGFKPSVGVKHYLPWGVANLGYDRVSTKLNGETIWVEKSPELSVNTNLYHIGNTPITIKGGANIGYWKEGPVKGRHTGFFTEVSHDAIELNAKTKVKGYVGYQYDHYGYGGHTRNLPYWGIHASTNVNSRVKAWVGYRHHGLDAHEDSPYEFDRIDVPHNLYYGLSVRATRLDTLAINVQRDMQEHRNRYVDITWHRDMHSFYGSLTYRTKQHRWEYTIKAKDF